MSNYSVANKEQGQKVNERSRASLRQVDGTTKPDVQGGAEASILDLQRAAGNHAVSQLLQPSAASLPASENGAQPIGRRGGPSLGRPLDPAARTVMESRFGCDFGAVRVHTDRQTQEGVAGFGAKAVASGIHIWFGPGHGPADQKLLAHELTHVVQQAAGQTHALRGAGGNSHVRETLEKQASRLVKDLAPTSGAAGVLPGLRPSALRPSAPPLSLGTGVIQFDQADEVIERYPVLVIESELSRTFTHEKDPRLSERIKMLAKAFGALTGLQAKGLLDRLERPQKGDAFPVNFGKLTRGNRGRFRQVLQRKAANARSAAGRAGGPGTERSRASGDRGTLLKYAGQPDKERRLRGGDQEFRNNYIDNNIDDILALANDPENTNLLEASHEDFGTLLVVYKDGRRLNINTDQVPLTSKRKITQYVDVDLPSPPPGLELPEGRGNILVRTGPPRLRPRVDWYEMREGFIYPIVNNQVVFNDHFTPNIVAARTILYQKIEELKKLQTLMETAATFSGLISASAGILTGAPQFVRPMRTRKRTSPPKGQRPPKRGSRIDPEVEAEVNRAFEKLPEADPHSGAKGGADSQIRSGVGVRTPVKKSGEPAQVLEVGAGPKRVELGLPPERRLVAVTRADISDKGQPNIILDATKPMPKNLHGKFTTMIINNPYGYQPNIAELKSGLVPGGKIIVQGNWKRNKYFRGLAKVKAPGMKEPIVERNVPMLGEGFSYTNPYRSGAPVPDSRITFELQE